MTAVAEPLSTLVPRKQMFVRSMEETLRRRVARVGLLHRHGLAGQCRLDEEQVLGGNEPDVAGNHVARRQLDHVARHELLERDFLRLSVAHDGGGDADHRLEFGGGIVGPGFLDKAESYAQDHHQQHHHAGPEIPSGERQRRQHGQQNHQRVARGDIQPLRPALLLFCGRLRWGRIAPAARRLPPPSSRWARCRAIAIPRRCPSLPHPGRDRTG